MPRVRSTAFRFAALFALVFTLIAVALGTAGYWLLRRELWRELDARIVAEASELQAKAPNALALRRAVAAAAKAENGHMRFALLASDGTLLIGDAPVGPVTIGWSEVDFVQGDGTTDGAHALATPLQGGEVLLVASDPETVEQLDERMLPVFAIIFGITAIAGIGGSFLLSSLLRRRLEAIDATARAIIDGKLDQRMPISGSRDEFDRLSLTLNAMLDQIEDLMENLRQVSGDIAHDLRTPLTRMRQKLEFALSGPASAGELTRSIEDAVEHSDEMLALFSAILSISEVEAAPPRLSQRAFDLSALVRDLADSYGLSAEDAGRSLSSKIAPNISLNGNRELIAQLAVNLLDNSLRHTPPGAQIELGLAADGGQIELTVADNGSGIEEADREHVFQRFTRLERSRSTPGHGLGLSLVRAIAAAHGATVRVEDNRPGARFVVHFPRSQR